MAGNDQPDEKPPTSSMPPISMEEADRLAESFKPIWDVSGTEAVGPAKLPEVAPKATDHATPFNRATTLEGPPAAPDVATAPIARDSSRPNVASPTATPLAVPRPSGS